MPFQENYRRSRVLYELYFADENFCLLIYNLQQKKWTFKKTFFVIKNVVPSAWDKMWDMGQPLNLISVRKLK